MANFLSTLQGLGGIFASFQAANLVSAAASQQAQTIRVGGEIAAQGALLSAAGFRQSRDAVAQATVFNLQIDNINLHRRLKAGNRQFQRALGQQLTQQAATGLATTSKSFLQLRNESADIFSKALLNMKIDAENTRRAKIFESQVQQTNLENQARAAEYRAAAERVMAANRAAEAEFQGEIAQFRARQSAFRGLSTLLG